MLVKLTWDSLVLVSRWTLGAHYGAYSDVAVTTMGMGRRGCSTVLLCSTVLRAVFPSD